MGTFFTIMAIIVLLVLWIMVGIGICFVFDMIHDIKLDKRRGDMEGKIIDIRTLIMAIIGDVVYIIMIIWELSILL